MADFRDAADQSIAVSVRTDEALKWVRLMHVVLATARRDHDTADHADTDLAALCQRCQIKHDRAEHPRRRWEASFQRGD